MLSPVRPGHAGSGAGLLNTVQQAGGALGGALVGALYVLGGGAADGHGVLAGLAPLGASVMATAALLARMGRTRA